MARDAVTAFGLWQSLRAPYLDARCHTDRLGARKSVVSGGLHVIDGTQHIERFNATLRLRVAHLVRRSLPFSHRQARLNLVI